MRTVCLLLSLLLLGTNMRCLVASTTQEDAASTVVIYNTRDPESQDIADFYCSARGIDRSHEIGLTTPTEEEISRIDYDVTIASPLRHEFAQRGYWVITRDMMNRPIIISTQIRYAVLIRGLPLKIKECSSYSGDAVIQPAPYGNRNAASIDSELSILGLFTPQISGVIRNPVCNNNPQTAFQAQIPPSLLFVGRLDAPDSKTVKAMVLDGLKTEREGLWGWGYVDLRSIETAGYVQGDRWIRQAGEALRRVGIPVISDDLSDTFQSGFPITDASAYYGWYTENIDGPFADPFFRFVPGTVAAHLHSFSATTLHDPRKGWTAPLLVHGASASIGNVYEPYLGFTTDFGVLAAALTAGCNLGESYYMAQPVLSWMSVLVGDPLYRPYASLAAPESLSPSKSVWTDYRRIILSHQGDVLKSAADLVKRSEDTRESLYLEALGSAQMDGGYYAPAETSFHNAGKIATDPRIQFRLLLEEARAMEKQGEAEKGASLLRQGLVRFTGAPERSLLLSWIARMDPIKSTPTPNTNSPSK